MKTVLFTDGSPGHEKQSRAVLEALGELCPIEVETIRIHRKSIVKRIIEYLQLVLIPEGGCEVTLNGPDLIIGTGSATHLPLLAAKKRYGAVAVCCMTPDAYLRNRFDLCFVPYHDQVAGSDNMFVTHGPPVLSPPQDKKDEKVGLILVGGIDELSHRWDGEKITRYIKNILINETSIHWDISSSPRTPDETVSALEELAAHSLNATFFNYTETPKGWLETKYEKAATVWVTADSMSMVYEAVTAGCKVGIFPLAWKKKDNKFQKSLDSLLEKNLIISFEDLENKKNQWKSTMNFNEASRCAAEIVRRWR